MTHHYKEILPSAMEVQGRRIVAQKCTDHGIPFDALIRRDGLPPIVDTPTERAARDASCYHLRELCGWPYSSIGELLQMSGTGARAAGLRHGRKISA